MFKVLIPAAAAIALVTFTASTDSFGSVAVGHATGMGWHLSHEGAMAKLAYGLEDSDQLALMITCSPGDSTAVVYGDVQPDTPRLIATSHGPTPMDPISGGDAVETRITMRDPSLTELVSKGVLRVQGEAGSFALRADGDDRRMIAGFLAYCGSSRA